MRPVRVLLQRDVFEPSPRTLFRFAFRRLFRALWRRLNELEMRVARRVSPVFKL